MYFYRKEKNSDMKKQSVHRQYNFPDADLYIQCLERIKYAHRDIAQFEKYGYGLELASGELSPPVFGKCRTRSSPGNSRSRARLTGGRIM